MTRVSWALSRMAEWLSIWGSWTVSQKMRGVNTAFMGYLGLENILLGCYPPFQDSHDHQDYYYIFRIGVSTKNNLHFTSFNHDWKLGRGVDPQLRMAICTKPWPTAPPWPKPRAWSRVPKRGVGVCRAGGHLDLLLSHEGLGYLGWKNKNREINKEIDDFTIFTPSHEVQIPHFSSFFHIFLWFLMTYMTWVR